MRAKVAFNEQKEVIGIIYYDVKPDYKNWKDVVCLHVIKIDTKEQKKGIGSALMSAMVDDIKKYNPEIKKIRGFADKNAKKFYEKLGASPYTGEAPFGKGLFNKGDQWYEKYIVPCGVRYLLEKVAEKKSAAYDMAKRSMMVLPPFESLCS